MKLLRVFSLYCLSLGLLCSVAAKPITTEKIIFMSSRDGNWEIYMMNPDGSQQERLTTAAVANNHMGCYQKSGLNLDAGEAFS